MAQLTRLIDCPGISRDRGFTLSAVAVIATVRIALREAAIVVEGVEEVGGPGAS